MAKRQKPATPNTRPQDQPLSGDDLVTRIMGVLDPYIGKSNDRFYEVVKISPASYPSSGSVPVPGDFQDSQTWVGYQVDIRFQDDAKVHHYLVDLNGNEPVKSRIPLGRRGGGFHAL